MWVVVLRPELRIRNLDFRSYSRSSSSKAWLNIPLPSDIFLNAVYYFAQAGSNFEPVYIFEVIYGLQRARISPHHSISYNYVLPTT